MFLKMMFAEAVNQNEEEESPKIYDIAFRIGACPVSQPEFT